MAASVAIRSSSRRRGATIRSFAVVATRRDESVGHSWVGLLWARALDPRLATPVPLAFACDKLLFFVPASGGKNHLVVTLVARLGAS